jgi:hypothetical protein
VSEICHQDMEYENSAPANIVHTKLKVFSF